ncbi:hypothetical protein [Actinomadura rugatobispora]|uniref:Cellulose synthase n=1 Tax=Actinomadura rugatobispora TaxID=1994 RepID=A0ABW1AIR8_9ACTN|nr:hypothetical protein GCM10010200_089020 [Actinomadura rugatobispora]
MTDATIFAISLGITLLGLVISWGVYRRRGLASGMRGAAWSLVPVAATMTGVTAFFVDLATFSATKWAGAAIAGVAVLLYLTSGVMLARRAGAAPGKPAAGGREEPKAAGKRAPKATKPIQAAGPAADPEMAEIEEILRNRGIK